MIFNWRLLRTGMSARRGNEMASSWNLLESGGGNYALNMAMDEALLEAMPRLGAAVLRFYGWDGPAASFGYFQKYDEVEQVTRLRPLVRRPTGGGLVPHDADWTYSLAFPTSHEWYSVTARESYRRAHEWIQAALARLEVAAVLATSCRKAGPGQCFVGHEESDLLWNGQKIAGAAQRRTRWGLLIQGSVRPPLPLARGLWQKAMREVGADRGADWLEFSSDQALLNRAEELATQKYSQAAYNRKR